MRPREELVDEAAPANFFLKPLSVRHIRGQWHDRGHRRHRGHHGLTFLMFKPSSKLKRWYLTYNKLYFDNQLPEDVKIGFNDELTDDHGVQLSVDFEFPPGHKITEIHLDPKSHASNSQLKLSLLHEMAHIRLHPYPYHGKKFQDEMRRLATIGAFEGIW